MGWTIHYQVVREAPLREDEIAQLAELVREQRQQPWDAEPFSIGVARAARADRVIVAGWHKLAMGDDSGDPELAEAAIEALGALLGADVRVRDDFGALDTILEPLAVSWQDFVDPTTLHAATPVVVGGSDPRALLTALAQTEDKAQQQRLHEQLAALDAHAVASAGFAQYATLGKNYEVRRALHEALKRIADPASFAHDFLGVWRNPQGTYHYGDMWLPAAFEAAIARVPEVVDQLVGDIGAVATSDRDIEHRRGEAAVKLLGKGGQTRLLIEIVRARRGKQLGFNERLHVFNAAHRVLAEGTAAQAVPTLLHFLGSAQQFGPSRFLIDGVIRFAPERARPHVLELATRGVHRGFCIGWLKQLGDPEAQQLAAQLTARGEAPLQDRAVDVDRDTRHDALKKLLERKDPSTYVSLVLAEGLDKYLRARYDDPFTSYQWWDWKDMVPEDVLRATTAKKLQWYDLVGMNQLGEQEIWPSVAEIKQVGPGRVAERYPGELLAFDRATLDALEHEEAANLAQL